MKKVKEKSTAIPDFPYLSTFVRTFKYHFGAAHGKERAPLHPLPIICYTYPTMMKFGTFKPYLKKKQKICKSRETALEFSIFHQKLAKFRYVRK